MKWTTSDPLKRGSFMLKLLLTRPSYETTTNYLFAWNQKIVDTAKIKKLDITDLSKEKATKKKLTEVIMKNKPDLVLLNGHGAPDLITGQNNEILIKTGVNENILKGTDVYAFSCETGKILGPASIASGAKSYIGYDEPFVFITTKGKERKPLEDKRAAYFLNPAIEVSLTLMNGETPMKASKKSKNAIMKTVRNLISSGKKEAYLVRYLLWNLKHQVCLIKQE